MAQATASEGFSAGKIGSQGMLLMSGYGLAQGLSLARNAILGHVLSPRDFGIAASITLLLQVVETLSDLGHDRLIVQAKDGGSDSFIATAHSVLVARGLLLAAILFAAAPWAAGFFLVPEAADAFRLMALVPLIKGFMHLDCRKAQRDLNNAPQLAVEIAPQILALAAALPLLALSSDYRAVVMLALIQAISTVMTARMLASSPYRVGTDRDVIQRLLAFGWPILLSALPLIAVYHGDRTIVARVLGVEQLAIFSAAFMATMVPGLLAARAGHALLLPVFSAQIRSGKRLIGPFLLTAEAVSVLASLFLAMFVIAGGVLLPLVFGKHYSGCQAVLSWLASMWALRMIQAVPGMALMAAGQTKPFLVAGALRASVLPFVLVAALKGAPLWVVAAIGCAGEVLSLLYVAWRIERVEPMLGAVLLCRSLFLIPAGITAALVAGIAPSSLWGSLAAAAGTSAGLAVIGAAVMPGLLGQLRGHLHLSVAHAKA